MRSRCRTQSSQKSVGKHPEFAQVYRLFIVLNRCIQAPGVVHVVATEPGVRVALGDDVAAAIGRAHGPLEARERCVAQAFEGLHSAQEHEEAAGQLQITVVVNRRRTSA